MNAPSLDEENGIRSKLGLETLIKNHDHFYIKTNKRDKYSRYVADVFLPDKNQNASKALENGLYLNQELLDQGLAERIR